MIGKPHQTLNCLARYYKSEGYKNTQIKKNLEEFLLRSTPNVNLDRWERTINKQVKNSHKHPLLELDYIPITHSELDTIALLSSTRLKRLAFTLLCLAKFYNIAKPNNFGWVNNSYSDIFNLANIKTSSREQCNLISKLCSLGMVCMSKSMTNLSLKVEFISDDTDEALKIDDFRNLGYQYLMHLGEPYIACSNCGLVVRKTGVRQKYCPECADTRNKVKTSNTKKAKNLN